MGDGFCREGEGDSGGTKGSHLCPILLLLSFAFDFCPLSCLPHSYSCHGWNKVHRYAGTTVHQYAHPTVSSRVEEESSRLTITGYLFSDLIIQVEDQGWDSLSRFGAEVAQARGRTEANQAVNIHHCSSLRHLSTKWIRTINIRGCQVLKLSPQSLSFTRRKRKLKIYLTVAVTRSPILISLKSGQVSLILSMSSSSPCSTDTLSIGVGPMSCT